MNFIPEIVHRSDYGLKISRNAYIELWICHMTFGRRDRRKYTLLIELGVVYEFTLLKTKRGKIHDEL